jgi:sulfide:quinone oxidoreductase
VYAAGDVTSFPIKQGGLAAQQADLIAQRIASENGGAVKELRVQHVLRARLLGGAHPVFLRAELDELGRATTATLQVQCLEEGESLTSPEKVFGRYLTPYLHTREPVLSQSLTDG